MSLKQFKKFRCLSQLRFVQDAVCCILLFFLVCSLRNLKSRNVTLWIAVIIACCLAPAYVYFNIATDIPQIPCVNLIRKRRSLDAFTTDMLKLFQVALEWHIRIRVITNLCKKIIFYHDIVRFRKKEYEILTVIRITEYVYMIYKAGKMYYIKIYIIRSMERGDNQSKFNNF